jgi:hypothetical protein
LENRRFLNRVKDPGKWSLKFDRPVFEEDKEIGKQVSQI